MSQNWLLPKPHWPIVYHTLNLVNRSEWNQKAGACWSSSRSFRVRSAFKSCHFSWIQAKMGRTTGSSPLNLWFSCKLSPIPGMFWWGQDPNISSPPISIWGREVEAKWTIWKRWTHVQLDQIIVDYQIMFKDLQSIPLLLLWFLHGFLGQLGFLLQFADLLLQTSSRQLNRTTSPVIDVNFTVKLQRSWNLCTSGW